jgi:hypothetical protein
VSITTKGSDISEVRGKVNSFVKRTLCAKVTGQHGMASRTIYLPLYSFLDFIARSRPKTPSPSRAAPAHVRTVGAERLAHGSTTVMTIAGAETRRYCWVVTLIRTSDDDPAGYRSTFQKNRVGRVDRTQPSLTGAHVHPRSALPPFTTRTIIEDIPRNGEVH